MGRPAKRQEAPPQGTVNESVPDVAAEFSAFFPGALDRELVTELATAIADNANLIARVVLCR
jgi:hypothetical protein